LLDVEGRLEFMNPAGESLLSIRFDQYRGIHYSQIDFPEPFHRFLEKSLSEPLPSDASEIDIAPGPPSLVFGAKSTSFLPERDGPGILVIFNDISERKRLERELIQSEKMFSCGLLSTGMAHDFNNILNRIRMALDILIASAPAPENRELHREIEEAVREGQSMTYSLLTFAKKETIALMPVDLYSALKTFEEKTAGMRTRKRVELEIDCPRGTRILSEPNHLQQILTNLLHNTVQAFDGNSGRIVLRVESGREFTELGFIDDGPGISREVLPHIFEPFFTTKIVSRQSGWGLGLALVRSLVEKMRGSIRVESPPGEGTRVSMKFPAAPIEKEERPINERGKTSHERIR
jgi:signal transduction histidine kinase